MDALGRGKEAASVDFVGSSWMMAKAGRIGAEMPEVATALAGDVEQILFVDGKEHLFSGKGGRIGRVNSAEAIPSWQIADFGRVLGIVYMDGSGRIQRIRFQQDLIGIPSLVLVNCLFPFRQTDGDDVALLVWKWKWKA